jgi:hypothetical protein
VRQLQDAVARQHGLFIVNHPALPSNEHCMGCGWTAKGTDYARVDAIEVVNGGAIRVQGGRVDGPLSGVPFWEARLNEGYRITAVGGSDNHQPDTDGVSHPQVGYPTTAIFAENLSQRALLDAVRAGRVFIDIDGEPGRVLELTARCGQAAAAMGQAIAAPAGAEVEFTLRVAGAAGARVDVILDGRHGAALDDVHIEGDDAVLTFPLTADGARRWIRADVRSSDDERTLMIGNPIYFDG